MWSALAKTTIFLLMATQVPAMVFMNPATRSTTFVLGQSQIGRRPRGANHGGGFLYLRLKRGVGTAGDHVRRIRQTDSNGFFGSSHGVHSISLLDQSRRETALRFFGLPVKETSSGQNSPSRGGARISSSRFAGDVRGVTGSAAVPVFRKAARGEGRQHQSFFGNSHREPEEEEGGRFLFPDSKREPNRNGAGVFDGPERFFPSTEANHQPRPGGRFFFPRPGVPGGHFGPGFFRPPRSFGGSGFFGGTRGGRLVSFYGQRPHDQDTRRGSASRFPHFSIDPKGGNEVSDDSTEDKNPASESPPQSDAGNHESHVQDDSHGEEIGSHHEEIGSHHEEIGSHHEEIESHGEEIGSHHEETEGHHEETEGHHEETESSVMETPANTPEIGTRGGTVAALHDFLENVGNFVGYDFKDEVVALTQSPTNDRRQPGFFRALDRIFGR